MVHRELETASSNISLVKKIKESNCGIIDSGNIGSKGFRKILG